MHSDMTAFVGTPELIVISTMGFRIFCSRASLMPGPSGAVATDDVLWQTTFEVAIGPHPSLTPGQQEIVSKDYGMRDGRLRLKIRYAMLFYVLKRLGLLEDAKLKDSRHQHIIVLNWKEAREALKRVGFEADGPSPGEERNARAR
jgi:hypothetical protein